MIIWVIIVKQGLLFTRFNSKFKGCLCDGNQHELSRGYVGLFPLKRANQARTHHSICMRKMGHGRDITWASEEGV